MRLAWLQASPFHPLRKFHARYILQLKDDSAKLASLRPTNRKLACTPLNWNLHLIDQRSQVLIVDDSKLNRRKMTKAAQTLGLATMAVADGAKALTALKGASFDLVLLDIEMPVLDGFGVLSAMRDDADLADIPVIVISAIEEMDSIVRAIELGAQDFLPKDFERVLFAARVNSCLEQKRLSDQRADHLAQIEAEKTRIDKLLSATLPSAAIEELKATNEVKPRRFENVVVLFADVVEFTAFCDTNPPELAVSRLESLVNGFEDIAVAEGLEKIKTIGDAFMATAGLLEKIEDPVRAAARCALKMAAAAPDLAGGWRVRVGVHIGPVVAGVIGQQQHLYDLWGDTVNTAARITSIASPSSVCISRTVWDVLDGDATSLGEVKVKGKTNLETLRLCRLR